jgi:hypothetical protein
MKRFSFVLIFLSLICFSRMALCCKCATLHLAYAYRIADAVVIAKMISEDRKTNSVDFELIQTLKEVESDKSLKVRKSLKVYRTLDSYPRQCWGFLAKDDQPHLLFLSTGARGYEFFSNCYADSSVIHKNGIVFSHESIAEFVTVDRIREVLGKEANKIQSVAASEQIAHVLALKAVSKNEPADLSLNIENPNITETKTEWKFHFKNKSRLVKGGSVFVVIDKKSGNATIYPGE